MYVDISKTWQKIEQIINGFFTLLPNIVLASAIFVAFCFVARGAKSGFFRNFGEDFNQENRV